MEKTLNLYGVRGDLFDSIADAIVNPVNTVGVQGAGLALKFKNKFPGLDKEYKDACRSGVFEESALFLYEIPEEHKGVCAARFVICLPTKHVPREDSSISLINRGLFYLVNVHYGYGLNTIAFPRIGCGLGRLNWQTDVLPVMQHHLDYAPFNSIVYSL